jgi:hypothetical protein
MWISAHWGQFVQPGWRYLSTASGSSGFLPAGGTYVTLVSPTGAAGGFALILESMDTTACGEGATGDQALTFVLTGGLAAAGATLHVWMTTQSAMFQQMADITVGADGSFQVYLPLDAMMTITTTTGQAHGRAANAVPPPAPLALPYADNFNEYPYDTMARYFADQGGSFAARNGSLVQVVPVDPGANAWVPDPDPLTLIGDAVAWADYTVSVQAVFNPFEGVDAPGTTLLAQCDAASPAQAFFFGTPASGYLSNTVGFNTQCVNVDGCASDLIFYQCVTTGGTCCGADCYENLQWSINANGQLVSALNGQCATSSGATLNIAPCVTGAPSQTWTYNSTTGQLRLPASNMCLSTPPRRSYVSVCARVTKYDGFDAAAPPPGYCVSVNATAGWAATAGSTQLAAGVLNGGYNSTAPHTLELTVDGTSISASVDGTQLFSVSDSTYTAGLAGVGSGYHFAAFDNFAVTPTA